MCVVCGGLSLFAVVVDGCRSLCAVRGRLLVVVGCGVLWLVMMVVVVLLLVAVFVVGVCCCVLSVCVGCCLVFGDCCWLFVVYRLLYVLCCTDVFCLQ